MSRTLVVLVVLLSAAALPGCLDQLTPKSAGSGDWAREFLQPDPYSSLVFEVDYVSGQRPSSSAMDLLKQRAEQHLRKPGGVEVRLGDTISTSRSTWTTEAIRDTEDQHRDRTKEGSTAVMYVLYLDGRHSSGDGVVGLAYSASSFAIFKDKLRDSAGRSPLVSTAQLERAVVVHELGHNLGLVNNGIPMVNPHEDPDHPRHSDNDDSVMFWAVETNPVNNFVSRFNTDPPTTFDADDRRDMENAGGK